MQNKNKTDWNLLAKHFAGETDEHEKALVSEWTHSEESNALLFSEISTSWKNINRTKEMNLFDIDKGWEKLHRRIATSAEKQQPANSVPFAGIRLISLPRPRMAAAITLLLLLAAGSTWLYVTLRENTLVTVASAGKDNRTSITLPDGSVVFMNANTKITYSRDFNSGNREIDLTGEAFFDVIHQPDRPFIVNAGEASVKVLGTSFNVQAAKSTGAVEVYVESGKVRLYDTDNSSYALDIEPGYIGTLGNEGAGKQKNTDANYLAWKTRSLYFDNTAMAEVARGILDIYQVSLQFENPEMSHCRIQGNFEKETLENVLETICTIHNWKWERKGDRIRLSGQGCD
jgi:ferric-dicitrate binding protein FerR (iron transport regulator)